MFSATEPLASSPLATNGTTNLISGAGNLFNAHQILLGSAAKRKFVSGAGNLFNAHHVLNGSTAISKRVNGSANLFNQPQILAGNSYRARLLNGSAYLSQGAQIIQGSALYTRMRYASADLNQAPQEVFAICYAVVTKTAYANLRQRRQLVAGEGTVLKTQQGSSNLFNPAQTLRAAGTRIRTLYGAGDLLVAPPTLYGSEFAPIWIKTPIAPINLYEVSHKITSEPYSTTNHYLTIYQVPGYQEVQLDGTVRDINITGIITAMSATTANGTPQSISIIVVKVDGVVSYPIMPSYGVTKGIQNIMPMRDFNLVTGDVIQVKSTGTGDVTVNMSILLNTQAYYEVL